MSEAGWDEVAHLHGLTGLGGGHSLAASQPSQTSQAKQHSQPKLGEAGRQCVGGQGIVSATLRGDVHTNTTKRRNNPVRTDDDGEESCADQPSKSANHPLSASHHTLSASKTRSPRRAREISEEKWELYYTSF